MRHAPHPISGFVYMEQEDGTVRVEDRDRGTHGIFKLNGEWISGALTFADPLLLVYVAGQDLNPGWDMYWPLLPLQLDTSRSPMDDEESREAIAKAARAAPVAGTDVGEDVPLPPMRIGKYRPDPGKATPDGPRSAADIDGLFFLNHERHPERLPESFRLRAPPSGGPEKVNIDRYIKREYHDLEIEKLWKKIWQMACREDEIVGIGDYHLYEIATLSFIVVRVAQDQFKAYYNACPHRGRQLRDCAGKAAHEFRCPYHGWTWNIDGSLKHITNEWDAPGVRQDVSQLPEVRVATWGGFIFINPDPDAISLEEYMGPAMLGHFKNFKLENRYKQAHVSKIVRANWKACQEGFTEAYHIAVTHPHLLLTNGDFGDCHYDVFGNWARLGHLQNCMASAMRGIFQTEEEALNNWQTFADYYREFLRMQIGDEADIFSDAEINDNSFNSLFPNFSPWGGFQRIIYRFRPNGDNHEESIAEVIFLTPWPSDRPKPEPVPVHHLGADEPWTTASEIGAFAKIMDQDMVNLIAVQRGLKTKGKPYMWLLNYQEGALRNFHRLYNKYMGLKD